MNDINLLAIVVAAVVVVVVSTVWYIVFGKQLAELSPAYANASDTSPPPWKVGIELVRSLVVASVVACLAARLEISGAAEGIKLGLLLWVGFPVVLWTGAVMWEKNPPKLAAIHAGDWLLKLLVISVIVAVWT